MAFEEQNIAEAELNHQLQLLKNRFEQNKNKPAAVVWEKLAEKLLQNKNKLRTLYHMEATGGEPNLVLFNPSTDEYTFFDCSPESPKERRSTCYDRKAWEERKEHKPQTDAMSMAAAIGIEILTEEEYRLLQSLGKFDLKTSSWLKTPENIRKLGGAIFGDRRYDTVFVYHNGVQSYYSARGFRGSLKV